MLASFIFFVARACGASVQSLSPVAHPASSLLEGQPPDKR